MKSKIADIVMEFDDEEKKLRDMMIEMGYVIIIKPSPNTGVLRRDGSMTSFGETVISGWGEKKDGATRPTSFTLFPSKKIVYVNYNVDTKMFTESFPFE